MVALVCLLWVVWLIARVLDCSVCCGCVLCRVVCLLVGGLFVCWIGVFGACVVCSLVG